MQLPFSVTGTVTHNQGRGTSLGYPTANVAYSGEAEDGVYVGYMVFDNLKLPSLIFIGTAITFNETERKMEVFILDFNQNLYSKKVTVIVEKKQRGNIKFDSSEALVIQMKKDEEEARLYFTQQNNNTHVQ